ncbi:hypothetical protein H6503_04845 [Candidatus Woesearchaeota archaeon]|nr:hypothetical protein [Candidatus Woesearchaeota archaeon]
MGFIDILRKIGILRFGKSASTYKDSKQRPLEFQQSDVYDENKDLIGKKK